MDEHSQDMARIVELGEGEAYTDLYRAAPADFAARHGVRAERIGSAIALTMQSLDAVLFNRVIGLGLTEPATEAMVDDIVGMYRRAGTNNWAVQLSPAALRSELPGWLEAHGLARDDSWPKVYRGVEPPPAIHTGLAVRRVSPEHADAFSRIVCRGFGVPEFIGPWVAATIGRDGWKHYMAFDGERPVATGALFVRKDIGWLGIAATLASHWGRGAQGALMARRIQDGAAMGCRWLVTETGEDTPEHPNPSYHNMLRTGFRLAYLRPNYIWSG